MFESPLRPLARARAVGLAAAALLFVAVGCGESPGDKLAGTYVRTWKEGSTPDLGMDEEIERHALVLGSDGTWTSEHPAQSLQQFDVPGGSGRWQLQGVLLTINPTDYGPMQYTVSGDTLFPRTPARARMAESMMGQSMKIGADTYLLRER